MKFCDKVIQDQLLNGGKIIHSDLHYPIYLGNNCKDDISLIYTNEYNGVFDFVVSQSDLERDDWQIVDSYYDDIIANKILCFFWNDGDEGYDVGYLKSVNKKFSDYRFVGEILTNMGTTFDYYLHCKAIEGKKFNIMP